MKKLIKLLDIIKFENKSIKETYIFRYNVQQFIISFHEKFIVFETDKLINDWANNEHTNIIYEYKDIDKLIYVIESNPIFKKIIRKYKLDEMLKQLN